MDAGEEAPRYAAEGERVGDKVVGVEQREGMRQLEALSYLLVHAFQLPEVRDARGG